MSLSYLLSDDGLIFFNFSFCGALGLLPYLKSKKQKGSDSLPSLMGSYHKSYKFGLEGSLKMMLSMRDSQISIVIITNQSISVSIRLPYYTAMICVF